MAILPHIPAAQLLAKISRLLRPGLTNAQLVLRDPLVLNWAPESVQRAAVAQSLLEPYTKPHTRRQFFRNLIGAPHRSRQIEGILADRRMGDLYEEGADLDNIPFSSDWFENEAWYKDRLDDLNKRFQLADEAIARGSSPHDASGFVAAAGDDYKTGFRQADAAAKEIEAAFPESTWEPIDQNAQIGVGPHPATEWILNRILGANRRRAGWD